MNILVVPSRFPSKYQPNNYSFVKEQVVALGKGQQVTVVGAIPVSLRFFLKQSFSLGKIAEIEVGGNIASMIYFPAIPKLLIVNELIRYFMNKYLIKRAFRSKSFDLIHFHSVWSATVGKWCLIKYGIPYVITEHSSLFLSKTNRINKIIAKKAFAECSAVVAVSKSLSNALRKFFHVDSIVIPNLVDVDFFNPTVVESRHTAKTFTTVGNLVDVKNHEVLIRAFKEFSRNFQNFNLNIVGSGPNFEKLQRVISELEIKSSVNLMGFRSKTEIYDILNNSSFFVMPSKSETFGVAVIEAMSMKLPILCTAFGGVSDELYDVDNCIIVENTISDIASGLNRLSRIEKSNKIRYYVIERYSAEQVCTSLNNLYRSILNSSAQIRRSLSRG